MTFLYTDQRTVDSSALRQVWFDAETKRAAVKFKGSNSTYVYRNVTKSDYESLISARSVGGYLTNIFKPAFGPGERLFNAPVARGYADNVVSGPTLPVGTKVTTNGMTGKIVEPFSSGPPVGMEGCVVVKYDTGLRVWRKPSELTVVEPEAVKPLEVAESNTGHLVSLAPLADAPVAGSRFTVRFEVDGVPREYTSNFNSVNDALIAVGNIGNALDLTFVIKSVEQHFD